jgi:hypothetical protein
LASVTNKDVFDDSSSENWIKQLEGDKGIS